MTERRQAPAVSRRVLFALVAVVAAGIFLGPDIRPLPESEASSLGYEESSPKLIRKQARPPLGARRDRSNEDPRRSSYPIDPTPRSVNSNLIKVEFKLAPRVSSSVYTGDRWVSPPTFTKIQQGAAATIEGRAFLVGETGPVTGSIPQWTSTNQNMITATPDAGNLVVLTVNAPGETSLSVSSQGAAKTLSVKATIDAGAMRVEITQ